MFLLQQYSGDDLLSPYVTKIIDNFVIEYHLTYNMFFLQKYSGVDLFSQYVTNIIDNFVIES